MTATDSMAIRAFGRRHQLNDPEASDKSRQRSACRSRALDIIVRLKHSPNFSQRLFKSETGSYRRCF